VDLKALTTKFTKEGTKLTRKSLSLICVVCVYMRLKLFELVPTVWSKRDRQGKRKSLQTGHLHEFCGTLWRIFLFFRKFGWDKPVNYLKSIVSVSQTRWDKPGTGWDMGQADRAPRRWYTGTKIYLTVGETKDWGLERSFLG